MSGFPEKNLRTAQTITDDLGFDSIMVTDLFGGLTRKIPGVRDRPGRIRPSDDDRRRDRHGRWAGQRRAPLSNAALMRPTVTPQFQIGEFEEVKALADRFAFGAAIGVDNPYFHVNDGVTRDTSIIDGAEVINFSSYNYLGHVGPPGGGRCGVGRGAPVGQLMFGIAPHLR